MEMEWGQGNMTSLLSTHHVVSWGFDDLLYASLSKSNSVIKAPAPANTNTAAAGTTATAAAAATNKGEALSHGIFIDTDKFIAAFVESRCH